MAPIERWNKLFDGTEWAIVLEHYNPHAPFDNNFTIED
jgi:hypothetical protein